MIFIVNGIFGSSHSKTFLRILIDFRYTWELPVGGRDSFPVKRQVVYLLFQWKWAPARILLIYCLLCKRLFSENWLSGCFYIKYTFSFNLTWKESFLKSTVHRLTFDKYLVLHQLFIKHQLCLGSPEGFPSSMANLLMQYFYNFYNFGLFSRWLFDSVVLTISFCLFIKFVIFGVCKLSVKCFRDFSDPHCWKLCKTTEIFVRNENEMFK